MRVIVVDEQAIKANEWQKADDVTVRVTLGDDKDVISVHMATYLKASADIVGHRIVTDVPRTMQFSVWHVIPFHARTSASGRIDPVDSGLKSVYMAWRSGARGFQVE